MSIVTLHVAALCFWTTSRQIFINREVSVNVGGVWHVVVAVQQRGDYDRQPS